VIRSALATAVLVGGISSAQPATYFPPIDLRTAQNSVGATNMQVALSLSDPGVDVAQSVVFGSGGGSSVPFLLGTFSQAPSIGGVFPASVDAVATAPGVLVGTTYHTLIAVSSSGFVEFGTVQSGTFATLSGPLTPIPGSSAIAISAVPDGGAALLVLDSAGMISRWDLDLSTGGIVADAGFVGPGAPTGGGATFDQPNTLYFDGLRNIGFVGGRVLGDIYQFDPNLDAGAPTVLDAALVSQGRLAPPVSGLAMYQASDAGYLLAANGVGITIYDLGQADPRPGAFRVVPTDAVGPITSPGGVAVTNLGAGPLLPGGVIVVGDRTNTGLARIRWDLLAALDGGILVIDSVTDPRGTPAPDAGLCPDGGVPDGGACLPPSGGGGPGNLPGPPGPYVPPPASSSSCASVPGGPALAVLLLGLVLLVPRRRQRP